MEAEERSTGGLLKCTHRLMCVLDTVRRSPDVHLPFCPPLKTQILS